MLENLYYKWALIILIMIILCQSAGSQSIDSTYFISPVDHKMVLSGSFGELRANHFHSGIDIKTSNGIAGDTIRAAADGYISRLKVEYGGYGKAIYINHPNGTTTVYAHMSIMNDSISAFVLKHQKKSESYKIDINIKPNVLPVRQGDFIALIGNMGRSMGPHLHFEIRDTKSEQPINPFFYNLKPTDHRPPQLRGITLINMTPSYQVNDRIPIPINKDSIDIAAWRVGVSIDAYDQMDAAYNKNGIYNISLFVDDSLAYAYTTDRFSFDESATINAIIDYERKINLKQTRFQCFKLPGNECSMIKQINHTNGIIKLFESHYRKVLLSLTDYDGNTTNKEFFIRRKSKINPPPTKKYFQNLEVFKSHLITTDYFQWQLSSDALYRDCPFANDITEPSGSDKIMQIALGTTTHALRGYHPLSILIDTTYVTKNLHDKLIVVNMDTNTSYGGRYDDGVLDTKIDRFGNYAITTDTIAPTLVLHKNALKTNGTLVYLLYDNYKTKGSADEIQYNCYLNDTWIVGSYNQSNRLLTIDIQDLPLKKMDNTIKIKVWDDRNNIIKRMIRF